VRFERLSERLGVELWVKRDDASGGVEAGNKVRKLELLLGEARARGADTLVTCGGLQSNHARATAVIAASLGLGCVLVLRANDPSAPMPATGNVLLDRLVGARIRLVTPEKWLERTELMGKEAEGLERAGARPYVIPEGGSNGLGALGYVEAMREVRAQLDLGLGGGRAFDLVVHACGSGGTAAGVALGAACYGVAPEVRAFAVCNDAAYFERVVSGVVEQARGLAPALPPPARWSIDDRSKGPAYAVASPEQRRFIVQVARACGLVLDPVYTGKALFGLAQAVAREGALVGKRVLFIHTGGLPGLLAQGDELERDL
jgi:D-cysteine desulfhydrase